MAYIIDGGRYSAAEAKQMLRENFTPWLAIEFYELNRPPVDIGGRKFDVNDVIHGLIAIGAIDENAMFEQFITELLTLARTGKLGRCDLPYDIEDMDIRYVSDKDAGQKKTAPRSAASRLKAKAPAKKAPARSSKQKSKTAGRR